MKTRSIALLSTSLVLAAGGLGAIALTARPAPALAQPSAPATVGIYEIDGVHSSVMFRVKHMNVAHFYGMFNKVSGKMMIDPVDPAKSMLDVTVDATSVDTRNEGRDEHLKGADFFSVKEFPTIAFRSKTFTRTGDKTFDITGDLTFRGQTRLVTAKGEFTGEAKGRGDSIVQGMEARVTIKRTEFGNGFMVGKGLSDDVDLIVSLEGKR